MYTQREWAISPRDGTTAFPGCTASAGAGVIEAGYRILATTSISTLAPFGRAATSTVDRAG
ncbi:MAG: hypothetical protein PWR25_864 [Euryarchaeota archaeon]|jgi:hypothetical protein|nr:hypothetical protein [Euryarchaeota archaeon]